MNKQEILAVAPDTPGIEVRATHCKEGAGKNKLYIKRTHDGHIVYHCKHCSFAGRFRASTPRYYENAGSGEVAASKRSGASDDGEIYYGGSRICEFGGWPDAAKRWWLGYQLTVPEQREFQVFYHEGTDRVVIPVFNGQLLPCAYSGRLMKERTGAPKWITKKCRDTDVVASNPLDLLEYGSYAWSTLVIVEDLVSAIKVSRIHRALPLMGTTLRHEQILSIAEGRWEWEGIDNVVVWLDNDGPQITLAALTIKKNLTSYVKDVRIVRDKQDPKYYTTAELKEVIGGS